MKRILELIWKLAPPPEPARRTGPVADGADR